MMMERQCDAETQQALLDYVSAGGQLVLVGRMCLEEFDHTPCAILKDALGIRSMLADPPFTETLIDALGYGEIPASFVETYDGEFDEVIATRGAGEVIGFVKTVGRGRVLMFGATMGTWTLEDIDVVNRIALKMGCEPLFKLSEWADARVSRGEQGAFLFVNNYLDDPIETTVEYDGRLLFDGRPVSLPARSGTILRI
jgi:beta-galactosidase